MIKRNSKYFYRIISHRDGVFNLEIEHEHKYGSGIVEIELPKKLLINFLTQMIKDIEEIPVGEFRVLGEETGG